MLMYVKAGRISWTENKAEIWGQSPQPQKANGGSGAEPPTLGDFTGFFPKTYTYFRHSLV